MQEDSVIRNFRITATDRKNYNTKHYQLSATIAVGYKVNSERTLRQLGDTKDTQIQEQMEVLDASLAAYLTVAEGILRHGPELKAQPFFAQGTKVISEAKRLAESTHRRLVELLNKRIEGLLWQMFIGITALLLPLLLFMVWSIRRERAEQALMQELQLEHQFSDVLIDQLPGIFFLADDQARLVRWNRGLERLVRMSRLQLEKLPMQELVPTASRSAFSEFCVSVLQGQHGNFETELVTQEDGAVPVYINGMAIHKQHTAYMVGFALDIRKQKAKQDDLLEQATTDPLTGAYNRGKFNQDGADVMELCYHSHATLSMILLDIDHFKSVNDVFGHDAGDQVLQRLVAVLKSGIRELDTVYRYGGEEFVILSMQTDLAGAQTLAERLRVAIETSDFPIDRDVTASMGVCEYSPADEDDLSHLLKRTDNALYAAKHAGRNRVVACALCVMHRKTQMRWGVT